MPLFEESFWPQFLLYRHIYSYIHLLQFNGNKLSDGHNNDKKDHKGDLKKSYGDPI